MFERRNQNAAVKATGTVGRRKRYLSTLTVAASMVTLVGLAAAPASASAAGCEFSKTLCLYSGENFTGERIALSSLVPGGTCINLAESGWVVPARSAINTHSASAALFANEDCTGGPNQVSGSSSRASLGDFVTLSVWVAG